MQWDRRTALGVVMAAHGYPESPRKGDPITGLPPRRRCGGVPRGHAVEDGVVSVTGAVCCA